MRATASRSEGTLEPRAKRPRYTRGLLWDRSDDTLSSTALWSVTADPVPMVPADEFDNLPAIETIDTHPHLFKITTPIKVNRCGSGSRVPGILGGVGGPGSI